MKLISIFFVITSLVNAYGQTVLHAVERKSEKKIDILHGDRLLTSFAWYDSVFKPVLYPINTVGGTTVTRSYPFQLVPGERMDHPHQVGMFFTHESVNGHDFWNLSPRIPLKDRFRYGHIRLDHYEIHETGPGEIQLTALSFWTNYHADPVLEEVTTFLFSVKGNNFIIDRATRLKALGNKVEFKDAKDAMLGLRLARALEMPNDWKEIYVNPDGTPGTEAIINNEGVTGSYRNSEGITGLDVWGKKAKWLQLSGIVAGKKVAVLVIDHPQNPGYPTYWHARGYGLLAANPLGTAIFTNNQEHTNLVLPPGESVLFRHRILVHEGEPLADEEVGSFQFDRH